MSTRSLIHWIAENAERRPNADSLIFPSAEAGDRRITFAELLLDVAAGARALAAAGVEEGRLVLLVGEHDFALCRAFLAAIHRGAVPTLFPYITRGSPQPGWLNQLRRRCEQAGAQTIVTSPEHARSLKAALEGSNLEVVALPEPTGDRASSAALPASNRGGEDIAYVQFSSGTTGDPNGAMISHRAVMDNVRQLQTSLEYTQDDVFVGWAPLFHDTGLLSSLIIPTALGIKSVLLSPTGWARRPASLLRAIDRYRGSVTLMPNFAFAHTARGVSDRQLEGLDLSSWRVVSAGAEMIRRGDLDAFSNRLRPYGFDSRALCAGYGMAEAVVGVSHTAPGDEVRSEWISRKSLNDSGVAVPCAGVAVDAVSIVSCGAPIPGMAVSILADDGAPLPERHVGEIALRSRSLFSGYWGEPEVHLDSQQEPYRSGDLGYIADGELFICDRKRDLIIVGGRNFFPDQIEPLARDVVGPRCTDAVAFALANPKLGTELAVVVCELRGRISDFERDSIAAAVRRRIGAEFDLALADVRLVKRGWLPKTTSGKISRSATRERYIELGWQPRRVAAMAMRWRDAAPSEIMTELSLLAAEILGQELAPDENLFDAGATSLQIMELLSIALDDFDEIHSDAFFARPTIAQLTEIVRGTEIDRAPFVPEAIAKAASDSGPATTAKELARVARRIASLGPNGFAKASVERLAVHMPATALFITKRYGAQRLFAEEYEILEECRAAIAPQASLAELFERSVETNVLRLEKLSPSGLDRTRRPITTHCRHYLEEAIAGGSGIVLVVTHAARNGGLVGILGDRGLQDATAFVGRTAATTGWTGAEFRRVRESSHWASYEQTLLTRQLVNARSKLAAGGVVIVAGDGRGGRAGDIRPFHGRELWFGSGFAELAVETGAVVLPVIELLAPDGSVHVEFRSPLFPPGLIVPTSQMLDVYVSVLESIWSENLGSITWSHLRRYASAPPA